MLFVISGIHREFFWPERLPRCLVLGSAALTGKQVECQPSPSAWAAPGGPHCHHLCPAPSFPRAGPRGLFSVEPVGGDETLSKSDWYSLAEGRALIGFWKCRFFFLHRVSSISEHAKVLSGSESPKESRTLPESRHLPPSLWAQQRGWEPGPEKTLVSWRVFFFSLLFPLILRAFPCHFPFIFCFYPLFSPISKIASEIVAFHITKFLISFCGKWD